MKRVASCVSILLLIAAAACRSASGPAETLERFEFEESGMGGPVRVVLHARDAGAAREAAAAAFRAIAEVDAALSDYRGDSDASRLAAAAGGAPILVSADLVRALVAARRVAEATDGALDVTVGPVVSLWRAARISGRLPDDAAIEAARSLVSWRRVEVDPAARTARLATPGMRLDFGAIGKGLAADRALEALAAAGTPCALVEAGGDIALGDAPPGRRGWRVDVPGGGVVEASHRGVSTSGDLEQLVAAGGRRYSHVVDPRTGRALETVATVTVIAPDAATSDALATALGVVGRGRALALAESMDGVEARFRWRDGDDSVVTEQTSGFTTGP